MSSHRFEIRLGRRRFLQQSATLAAATLLLPRGRLWAQESAPPPLAPPSERINLAVIGVGNQGFLDREALLRSGLCQVVALCDVDLQGAHAQEALAAHPDARQFTDFRVMFDTMANDIDAVLIATPDHAHFCMAMQAMALGKHVYVEKPLAHTFGQCQRLMDMAARSGVVTQMGNQGHSGANYFQFKAWTEAGIIKDVTRISAFMNNPRRWHGWGADVAAFPEEPLPGGIDWDAWIGDAQLNPFSLKLHPQEWRSWFEYGSGAFGDWGPHILDTAHRFLELGLPTRISALKRVGANPFIFPQASTIRFSFPARKQMPPCVVTWYDGVDNLAPVKRKLGERVTDPETGESRFEPLSVAEPGKILYSKTLTFKGGSHSETLRVVPRAKELEVRETLPRISGKTSDHYTNFLRAIKGEETARSPFSVSGELTQVFTLGILAQRLGGTLAFDPQSKRITNNRIADALLDPAPRQGWEEYYRL